VTATCPRCDGFAGTICEHCVTEELAAAKAQGAAEERKAVVAGLRHSASIYAVSGHREIAEALRAVADTIGMGGHIEEAGAHETKKAGEGK
jgi:hypothetical protein